MGTNLEKALVDLLGKVDPILLLVAIILLTLLRGYMVFEQNRGQRFLQNTVITYLKAVTDGLNRLDGRLATFLSSLGKGSSPGRT